MSRLQEFCERVERDGIFCVYGSNFKDHKSPNGKYNYKTNTTPEQYCRDMGESVGASAEEYANELLNMMDAPSQKIVGECEKCFKLLTEFEAEYCGNSI